VGIFAAISTLAPEQKHYVTPMTLFRRTVLVALLLSQAIFMAAGSTLVLCWENESSAQFGLLMSSCCDEVFDATAACAEEDCQDEHHADREECGGCEDQSLVYASIERHDCPVPDAAPAPAFWSASGACQSAPALSLGHRDSASFRDRKTRTAPLGSTPRTGVLLRC
jgi:hypothetical protein